METLLKGMWIPLLLAWLWGAPVEAASVDIVVANSEPATLNLARAAEHALNQLRPAPVTRVLEAAAVDKAPAGDTLAITVGDSLLEWAASPTNAYAATLCFYVSSGNYAALGTGAGHRSALFRDQPLTRQLLLARALLPNATRALLIHSKPLLPPAFEAPGNRRFANFGLRVERVQKADDWAKPLSQWLIDTDVLIGVDDRDLYNRDTIRSVLLATYRHGKVLIGPNRGFVSAGSLASAYTSPEQYLQQLQTLVQTWQQNRALAPPEFPRQFQVSVNRQVATSLGLSLPDDQALLSALQALQNQAGEGPR